MNFNEKKLNIRAEKIASYCKKYIQDNDKVLDVGCGDGKMIILIKNKLKKQFKISGADVFDYNPKFNFKKIILDLNHLYLKEPPINSFS